MGKSWPKGKCFGSVQNRRMAGQIVFLNRIQKGGDSSQIT